MFRIQLKDGTDLLVNASVLIASEVIPDVGGDFVRLRYNDINIAREVDLIYSSLDEFRNIVPILKRITFRTGESILLNPTITVTATVENDGADFVRLVYNDINNTQTVDLIYTSLDELQNVLNSI